MKTSSRRGLNAFIYDAVRTPRGAGKTSGALSGVKPVQLLTPLYKTLQTRHPEASANVEDIVLGCSVQTGEQGTNLAKISALYAGFAQECSGVTLNRFCASGLDALSVAALKVSSGMEGLVVAGGVESSSRVGMQADHGPWFADPEVASKTRFVHMGVAADVVATLEGISRAACDEYALQSQTRAAKAQSEGAFSKAIIPLCGADGRVLLERDECVRAGVTLEQLKALSPAFAEMTREALPRIHESHPQLEHVHAVHHVGSAPAVADGASLLLVGNRAAQEQYDLKPRARVLSFANVAVDPVTMLTGTVPATRKALALAGLKVEDIDLYECNESFAAPTLAFIWRLELDPQRVNVNGGAIALGHPLGATGGMLVMTLLDALERRGQSLGVVTICAGAGIAQSLVLERV